MTSHDWNSDWLYFSDVEAAAEEISSFLRKWGRISAWGKEKYGTCRVDCYLGGFCLHQMIYPGYTYSQFPNWLWILDCKYLSRILQLKPIYYLLLKYQLFIYNLAYKKAVKRYPHIFDEIIEAASYINELSWVNKDKY